MNSLTKGMAGLGAKMQAATDSAKQKAEEMKAKAEEAIANAKTKKEGKDDEIPTEVETTIAPIVSEENSVSSSTPAKKISVRDSFNQFASQFKKEEEEIEISDLVEVLSQLFDFDPRAKKPHEMVESLELQGITTWRGFLLMAEEDISELTKQSPSGEVSISKNSIRMLTYLKQFTLHNITTGVENAKDPSIYTSDAFDTFVEDLQLGRLGKEEEPEKISTKERMDNVRASITGFATNFKPGFAKAEEGSIADILNKTQWKAFGKKDNKEVVVDEASADSSELATVDAHNEAAFESMKKSVDDLASKLESTAKNAKTKEEVQKLMVPLLSKLKASQDRFAHMMEARKKKAEEKKEAEEAAASEESAEGETTNGNKDKFKNLLSSAENATKRAFENAEKVARQAAKKAGIYDKEAANGESEAPTVPAQNGCKTEEAV